jgi:Domain of unknown function (DUF4160)
LNNSLRLTWAKPPQANARVAVSTSPKSIFPIVGRKRHQITDPDIGIGRKMLPSRALMLVQEWAMIHEEELQRDWELCRDNTQPAKIDPLA